MLNGFICALSLFIGLSLPESLATQCASAQRSTEEVQNTLAMIDSLGKGYFIHVQSHPSDTLGNPLESDGLTPENFCKRIGIALPESPMSGNDRKVFWGTTTDPDNTGSQYFVAVVTLDSVGFLPQASVLLEKEKKHRTVMYTVPIPPDSSTTFEVEY